MSETRKLAAILAADVVGFSRLTGADEDRTLARLRALRSDLIDPTIAVHKGRVVKRDTERKGDRAQPQLSRRLSRRSWQRLSPVRADRGSDHRVQGLQRAKPRIRACRSRHHLSAERPARRGEGGRQASLGGPAGFHDRRMGKNPVHPL
jgi:hypothetical protein